MKQKSNSFFQALMNIQSMKFMKSVSLVFMMSIVFLIPALSVDHISGDAQQNITVSGTVTDSEGTPMPGVSISIDFHGNLLGVYLGIRSSLKNNVFITEP
jgi:protocatechuate 3,4-dioxygenase beta subunit